MSIGDPMVAEKLEQVPGILEEHGFDAWLLFVRESHTVHDPCLDLVVGSNVTWPSAIRKWVPPVWLEPMGRSLKLLMEIGPTPTCQR